MLHARPDYQRFQDPAGKIPEDEPVLLLRGQDKYAARVAKFYGDLLKEDREVAPEMTQMIYDHAVRMANWPKHKTPDLERTGPPLA